MASAGVRCYEIEGRKTQTPWSSSKTQSVPSFPLSCVKCLVYTLKQTLNVFFLEALSDSNTNCNSRRTSDIRDCYADSFGDQHCSFCSGVWQQNNKLLTTKTAYDITCTDRGSRGLRDTPQHVVTNVMSERIIDLFKMVDIEKCDRYWVSFIFRSHHGFL